MENQKKILGASVATGLALLVGTTQLMTPSNEEQVIPTEIAQPESSEYVPTEPVVEDNSMNEASPINEKDDYKVIPDQPPVTTEPIGPLPGEAEAKPTITERVKRYFRREPKPKKQVASEKPRRLQGEKSSPNTSVTVSRTDRTYKLYSPPSISYQKHQSWGQMNSNKTAGYGDFEGYGADFGRTKSAYRGK